MTMKKVILMLAFAASLMVVSCGKGDGKVAGSDSAAAVEQTADDAAEALPTEPFTLKIRGVSGGEWDNFKPCLGEAKFTLGAEEGGMVNVEVMVPFESRNARAVKGVESANYQIYYSGEDNKSIYCDPMLELDKAEIPAVVEFVNAGKAGEEKDFKYVGKLKKADVLAMIKDGEMGALVKNFKFQE